MTEAHQSLEEILFDLALQKPTAVERAAFLDHACRDNPSLRAALEELLESHFGAEGFLPPPEPGRRCPNVPALTETVSLPAEAPAPRIGRYKLLEKLGEGGFGEVWMAEQREPVIRRVALKILKPGMDSRQVVARFEAERQALAMMDHPNIAKIIDAGTTGPETRASVLECASPLPLSRAHDGPKAPEGWRSPRPGGPSQPHFESPLHTGRPYFVMELVRGVKITEYCDQNQLTTRERLELFVKVCQAIQHAHQKGIIHRDIKPSNILVTLHDGVPVPKVIDFGIAKATQGELTDKTMFTQFQQFMGTPAYISPEQAEMSGLDVDTRSDIYSLGVLLYELLVGQTPFDARELMKGGLDVLRKTIREQEPLRPSTRFRTLPAVESTTTAQRQRSSPAQLGHQLRGDLDWIVMKCLEKDRARRYETANGLAADIQRYLASEPIVARPPSAAYKLKKTWQRNRLAITAAMVVLLALVIGAGVSTWQAVRATRALHESESITEFLSGMIQSPDPTIAGRDVTVLAALDRAVSSLEHDFAIRPERRARIEVTLGVTYQRLGMPLKAIPLLESARDHLQIAFGPGDPNTLRAFHALAASYRGVGRLEEAVQLWEKALSGRRDVLGPDHPDTLATMESLSSSYFNLGRQREAIQLAEDELRLQIKVHGRDHLATLSAMYGLAFLYAKTGRHDEAVKLAEAVAAGRRDKLGAQHAETLQAMVRLAEVYGYVGRKEKAYPLFKEVLPLLSGKFGPDHPETVNAATHFGRWCSNWAWDERGTNGAHAHALASEGERLIRQALPVFESGTNSPAYHLACIRSRMGGAISVAAFADPALTPAAREQRMIESESLMQLAQTAIGGDNLGCQRDAIERFVRLYEAWPKADRAAEWRRRLETFDLGLTSKNTRAP